MSVICLCVCGGVGGGRGGGRSFRVGFCFFLGGVGEVIPGIVLYRYNMSIPLTSILPCFRYRTPRFVQAITFYQQKKKL